MLADGEGHAFLLDEGIDEIDGAFVLSKASDSGMGAG
jgi:hypothetical protein